MSGSISDVDDRAPLDPDFLAARSAAPDPARETGEPGDLVAPERLESCGEQLDTCTAEDAATTDESPATTSESPATTGDSPATTGDSPSPPM